MITSEEPATAAAVFTTNRVQAAPVVVSREHVRRAARRMRAIVVNSGNANCATGPAGIAAAVATARAAARALGCQPGEIIVCSTGVIGVLLRVERILARLPELAASRSSTPQSFAGFARAIMTTDTRPKWAAASCRVAGRRVRLLGCAKGAGMIAPQMATMLAFVVTDAAIAPSLLRRALREIVGRTFNAITVDGDTSTNDTVAVLANGASGVRIGHPRASRSVRRRMGHATGQTYARFVAALETVCRKLALAIVGDGEGARRVIEIEVCGAPSDRAAEQVARTIANSPLVKTALAGGDPNWGRILAAAGRAGVALDPGRVAIRLAGIKLYSRGRPVRFDERAVHGKLLANYVPIVVDLGASRGRRRREKRNSKLETRNSGTARVWTCDFTADYVRINASYRT